MVGWDSILLVFKKIRIQGECPAFACVSVHIMAWANLNTIKELITNTTEASKYILDLVKEVS